MRAGLSLVALLACTSVARALPLDVPASQLHRTRHAAFGSSDAVFAIAESPDGYLWVGAGEAVYRYDGVEAIRFDRSSTRGGLPGGLVRAIGAAPDGTVYVTTETGLARYRDGRFSLVEERPQFRGHTQLVTSDGTVYVGTYDGVFVLSPGERRLRPLAALKEVSVAAFSQPAPGTLLVGMLGTGLAEVKGETVARRWPKDPRGFELKIRSIAVSGEDHLLATDHGVLRLHAGELSAMASDEALAAGVVELVTDRDGVVWASAGNDGLYRLRRGVWEREPGAASEGTTLTLLVDHLDHLWIGLAGGVVLQLREATIRTIDRGAGLPSDDVIGLRPLADGTLWVGFADRTTSILRPSARGVVDRADRVTAADGEPLRDELSDVVVDPAGGYHLGLEHGLRHVVGARAGAPIAAFVQRQVRGLAVVDGALLLGSTDGLFRWVPGAREPSSLFVGEVLDLRALGPGRVWASTSNGGLLRIAADGRTVVGGAPALRLPQIRTLAGSAAEVFATAMGFDARGLARIRDGAATVYGVDRGLPDRAIGALVDDGRGTVWFCIDDQVIGVPIAQLDEIDAGRRATISPTILGAVDGLGARCVRSSDAKLAADGRVWFSTQQGIFSFDPGAPRPAVAPPRALVEEVRIDGIEAALADEVVIPAGRHRVSFRFTAPTMIAPERLRFRYRLLGVDPAWQLAEGARRASFADLPPGSHRFEVQILDETGAVLGSAAAALRQVPRLDQRLGFRVAALGALIALLLALVRLRVRRLEARGRELERLIAERTHDLAARQADLTQALHTLRTTQDDLLRAERLASVATVVRGVAHELNNPIGVLKGNLDPLRRYTGFLRRAAQGLAARFSGSPEELAELTRLSPRRDLDYVAADLDKLTASMDEAAKRAHLIVGDLQDLGGSSRRPIELVSVDRSAEHVERIFASRCPPGVRLEREVQAGLSLRARAGELEQLLINLVDNALRAQPRSRVALRARALPDALEGIELVVEDDGAGMDAEVLARATQAFFTTRPPGEGSGLGLAVVASIASRQGGGITLSSTPGEGTRVTVRVLPEPIAAR